MEQKKQHYVDNKLFFAEMEKWKAEIRSTADLPYFAGCTYIRYPQE